MNYRKVVRIGTRFFLVFGVLYALGVFHINWAGFILPSSIYSQITEVITRISVNTSDVEANNTSTRNALDSDGSHVAFTSLASNLVDGDTNGYADIFVYTSSTGEIERVSVSSGGLESNGESDAPAISSNGRYVAFQSAATNLVSGDTNNAVDIFVYDRDNDTIERVSVSDAAAEGDDHSKYPSISGDGRYVAFQSAATNLVSGDTNNAIDVFVYDRTNDTISRASVSTAAAQGNNHSIYPAISDDGRYVAFGSIATNLVSDDYNAVSDVFLRDTTLSTTVRVSTPPNCDAGATPTPVPATPSPTPYPANTNGLSSQPSISEHGRYIAFESEASNLVCNDGDTNGVRDIFVADTYLETLDRVSVASDGTEGDGISGSSVDNPNEILSANGQYVVFKSLASNLVADDTNGIVDVFVHDRQTRVTSRINKHALGTEANSTSYYPSISAEGRYIGFYSFATNLVDNDMGGFGDVFVFDRDTLTPTLTPTPTNTPTPTPTPTPSGTPIPTPTQSPISVYIARNEELPTEVKVQTSAGQVTLRCDKVFHGGNLEIQVLSSPPGFIGPGFNILPTNFDIHPHEDLMCADASICLPYSYDEVVTAGLTTDELQLLHYWDAGWNDITTTNTIDLSSIATPTLSPTPTPTSTPTPSITPTGTLTPTATPTETPTPTPSPTPAVVSTSTGITGTICGHIRDFSPFVIGTADLSAMASPTPEPTSDEDLPSSGSVGGTFGFFIVAMTFIGAGLFLPKKFYS